MGVERDSKTGALTGVYRDAGNRPTLDPERVKRAQGRAQRAITHAEYLEGQAAVERAKAASICNTWGLDPATLEPKSQEPDRGGIVA